MPETSGSDFYSHPLAKPEKPDFNLADLAPLEKENQELYFKSLGLLDKLKTALEDINQLTQEEENKMACFEAALAFHNQLMELTDEENFKKLDEKWQGTIGDYLKHSWDFIEKSIDYHSEMPAEKEST